MINHLTQNILDDRPIDHALLEEVLQRIVRGSIDEVQTAGLLTALAARAPRTDVLVAGATVLRSQGESIVPQHRPLLDTCGTGGDGSGTFNISTAAAVVVAAAGVAVAKHGNRGVLAKVGSADVLSAYGCEVDVTPAQSRKLLDTNGFALLFSPRFHPAMANVAPVRRRLGIRTLFNLLGPLANPAQPECQLLGVYNPAMTRVMAEALQELGTTSALVVHCAGLDEIGLHAITTGHWLRNGAIESFQIDPIELGLDPASIEDLQQADTEAGAADLLRDAIRGEGGARSDVVALNAGAALHLADAVPNLEAGLEEARKVMARGAAVRLLDRYKDATQAIHASPPTGRETMA